MDFTGIKCIGIPLVILIVRLNIFVFRLQKPNLTQVAYGGGCSFKLSYTISSIKYLEKPYQLPMCDFLA